MSYYLFKYGFTALYYTLLAAAGTMAILTPIVLGGILLLAAPW